MSWHLRQSSPRLSRRSSFLASSPVPVPVSLKPTQLAACIHRGDLKLPRGVTTYSLEAFRQLWRRDNADPGYRAFGQLIHVLSHLWRKCIVSCSFMVFIKCLTSFFALVRLFQKLFVNSFRLTTFYMRLLPATLSNDPLVMVYN